jgi:hypothetical protein
MSRHILAPRPGKEGHEIVIGWDRPLATFFAMVRTGDDLPLWVGCTYGEILDPSRVIALVRPYALIPDDLDQRLRADMAREGSRVGTPGWALGQESDDGRWLNPPGAADHRPRPWCRRPGADTLAYVLPMRRLDGTAGAALRILETAAVSR